MNLLILVVDDEPDVEMLFRQHFRRDLREKRFTMEFAQSGDMALQRIADPAGESLILILSDINMLRHSCGYKLANDGQDTRAIQHYLGHKSINSTVRYTALAPDRFKGFWKD